MNETPTVDIDPSASETITALGMRPRNAWLSIAVPSWDHWRARTARLANTYVGDGFDFDAWEHGQARIWSTRLGLGSCDSFADLARAMHLKPEAAMGFYAAPLADGARYPAVAFAMQWSDPEASLAAVQKALFGSDAGKAQAMRDEGVELWTVEGRSEACCIAGPWLVGGSDNMMVWDIATTITGPDWAREVPYGSPECPVESSDEIAALVQMERITELAPLLDRLLDRDAQAEAAHPFLEEVASRYAMASADEVSPPAVVTVRWDESGLSWLYRMNPNSYPALAAAATEGQPLSLAPLLPPSSEAVLGFQFDDDDLKNIAEYWLQLLPEAIRSEPLYRAAELQLHHAANVLGDELAVGMMGISADQPSLMGIATLRSVDGARAMFGAFSPLFEPVDHYEEVEIFGLPEQIGFPLSYATADDKLILGPSPIMVRGALIQLEENEASPLFSSLDPPLDPDVPRSGLLVLPQKLLLDLVLPAARDGLGEERTERLGAFLRPFREVRFTREGLGAWRSTRLLLLPAEGYSFAETPDYGSLTEEQQ